MNYHNYINFNQKLKKSNSFSFNNSKNFNFSNQNFYNNNYNSNKNIFNINNEEFNNYNFTNLINIEYIKKARVIRNRIFIMLAAATTISN